MTIRPATCPRTDSSRCILNGKTFHIINNKEKQRLEILDANHKPLTTVRLDDDTEKRLERKLTKLSLEEEVEVA